MGGSLISLASPAMPGNLEIVSRKFAAEADAPCSVNTALYPLLSLALSIGVLGDVSQARRVFDGRGPRGIPN